MPNVYADLRGFVLAHVLARAPAIPTPGRRRWAAIGSPSSVGAGPSLIAGSRSTMRTRICSSRRSWRLRIRG